jgi:hypothetical protein
MKITLPKDMRGVSFPKLLSIELNDFDIDLFLPSLFFKVLGEGRARAPKKNDPTTIRLYVERLAEHPALEGFQDAEGRRMLERLVRTTLITTGRVGRGHRGGEQIMAITPYSLLAHKPGYPVEGSRQRNADTFLYHALRHHLGADDHLQGVVKMVFGRGVQIDSLPILGGKYDSTTEVDILTRLSLAFLDGFEPVGVGRSLERTSSGTCPALEHELAEDLLRYLSTYSTRMPPQALTHYLLGLINFELFIYTLKLVQATNMLVQQPDTLPAAMQEDVVPSPPQLYLDFTTLTGGLSRQMATACVERDVETYQRYLASNLLLRQLDSYVTSLRRNARHKAKIDQVLDPEAKGASYLQGLLLLQDHPAIDALIQASARVDEDRIREENTPDGAALNDDGDPPAELKVLDDLTSSAGSDVERVVVLLAESQRKQALRNFLNWYRGTGGLTKSHGILNGGVRSRRSWRYAPENDLLAILVQLAAARLLPHAENGQQRPPEPIRLQDFLAFLEQRFGILVDRPPEPFKGADYAAAARDNLRAMLWRLRQMGIFRDMSDDFTVQRLHPPYSEERTRA